MISTPVTKKHLCEEDRNRLKNTDLENAGRRKEVLFLICSLFLTFTLLCGSLLGSDVPTVILVSVSMGSTYPTPVILMSHVHWFILSM